LINGAGRTVCLLPARNAAAHLKGWFDSVERFADAVIALDDGSTDDTAKVLRAHPLVERVLTNPRRETYQGWDDAANRSRLLAAAAELHPAWIMQLDADERIPADDAEALRSFLRSDAADTDAAYLFRVHRMIGDLGHFDRADLWVGRLFASNASHRFPERSLHFVALPTSIPRDRWRKTTVRIQHLASIDEQARHDRYRKYLESDPERRYQASYENLLDEPAQASGWSARPPGLPAVMNGSWHRELADACDERRQYPDRPSMSAIVISRNDEDTIVDAVRTVTAQVCDEPIEVIVVTSGDDATADRVREACPEVTIVELDGVAYPGRARNAGLAMATGRYVSFPGSHVRLPSGSLQARLTAHRRGYAMVTGTTLNANTTTAAGWAAYFLDNNRVLPRRPSSELGAAPSHCSYLREALVTVGGFREDIRAGEDTLVNNELFRIGYGAWRDQDVQLFHRPRSEGLGHLVRHHFARGRARVRVIRLEAEPGRGTLTRSFVRSTLIGYVPDRFGRIKRNIIMWGDEEQQAAWKRVQGYVVAALVASWLGAWYEFLRTGRAKRGRAPVRP
jgi:glycosyltransferase involved in cell wall biosynthesis